MTFLSWHHATRALLVWRGCQRTTKAAGLPPPPRMLLLAKHPTHVKTQTAQTAPRLCLCVKHTTPLAAMHACRLCSVAVGEAPAAARRLQCIAKYRECISHRVHALYNQARRHVPFKHTFSHSAAVHVCACRSESSTKRVRKSYRVRVLCEHTESCSNNTRICVRAQVCWQQHNPSLLPT